LLPKEKEMTVKKNELGKHKENDWVIRRIRQLTKELHELNLKNVDVSDQADVSEPIFAQIVGREIGELENSIDWLLRLKDVLKIFPVSKSTWWAGVKSGRFPAPVHLGPGITAWRWSDLRKLAEEGVQ
jgi:predicted DNA-binding transcriptional regulator AlpA